MTLSLNSIFLYITAGVLFNLFIDGLTWILFKYGYLNREDEANIPWNTSTKIIVTFTWPAVLVFLIWTVFINPQKTEDE